MKYKILSEDTVKNLIEFLDDVQFEAAGSKDSHDLNIVQFCTYIITELLNSPDVYDNQNDAEQHIEDIEDIEDIVDDFNDMTDDQFKRTLEYYDSFFREWREEYSRRTNKPKKKKVQKQKQETKKISLEEAFEMFYEKREKKKLEKNSISLNKMLKDTKLRLSQGGSDTR